MVYRRRNLRRRWAQIGGGVCGVMTAGLLAPLVWELRDGAARPVDWLDDVWSLYSSFRQSRMMAMAAQPGGQAAMLRVLAVIWLACWIGRTLASVAAEDAVRRRREPRMRPCYGHAPRNGCLRRAARSCRQSRSIRRCRAARFGRFALG